MSDLKPEDGGFSFEVGEREKRIEEMKVFHLKPTRFRFINDHYGLKKSKRHILMGTSGTGKSTQARSLLLDIAKNHKVLVYSSEESHSDTKDMFALRGLENEDISNLKFLHEEEVAEACKEDFKNLEEFTRMLSVRLINSNAECLFFDNITTSDFYDGQDYNAALAFLRNLYKITKEFNIPLFLVAHTKAGIKDDQQGLIGPDDVKGPKALTNKCEFLYIYQKFIGSSGATTTPTYGTVRVRKARGMGNVDSTYLLDYDFDQYAYYGDKKITFDQFNEIYSERAKLGSKK